MWSDFVSNDGSITTIQRLPVVGGLYKHFKPEGDVYQVVCLANDEVDRNKKVVVYVSTRTGEYWVRSVEVFMSKATPEDYPDLLTEEVDRFQYVGSVHRV